MSYIMEEPEGVEMFRTGLQCDRCLKIMRKVDNQYIEITIHRGLFTRDRHKHLRLECYDFLKEQASWL